MNVSKLASNLIGSEIIKIGNQVNDLKAQGATIANLTIGDLDANIYPIPDDLKEGIQKAYQNNLTNYPPANGLLSLRKSIASDLQKRWNLEYSTDDILVAGGSRPLIYACYKAIVDPGDKVIYPIPSWNNNHYTYLCNAEKVEVYVTPETNFLPTASDLQPYLSDAALVALCSPLNPTGTMFTKDQLSEICQLILAENKRRGPNQKPLYLMYDQIYALLTFEKEHYNPVTLFPEMKPYTLYIDGISKCFAATGVRVGWAFGPSEVVDRMKAFLTHIGAWAPKPEQQATAEYLTQTDTVDAFVNQFKTKLKASLETLHQGMQNLKQNGLRVDSIQPMGAMYLTLKLDYLDTRKPDGSFINNSSDLVFYLIETAGVALVPFSAFGTESTVGWFRASVGGCSLADIQQMMPRLQKALADLK